MNCPHCQQEIQDPITHRSCFNEAIWSEDTAVKIAAYQVLSQIPEAWAKDLLDQIYLDEADLEVAKAGIPEEESDSGAITRDSNGTQLLEGDSVTLIKDLDVKGAGFTAKRGTLVKNISLTNNPKHIEGKVNGIQIVLISAFLKKA
jgi:protein PhnA